MPGPERHWGPTRRASPGSPSAFGAAWRALLAFGLPAALLVVLALPRALGFPLSRDELATAEFASLTPGELATAVTSVDAVAAPYYLLVHAVIGVLPGDLGIRVPSLIAAAAAVVFTGMLAGRWWGVTAGAAAATVLAVNPLTVALAATARPAAIATACVALALLCADIATSARGRSEVAAWAGFAAATVAAGIMHLFSLLAVMPAVALALGRSRRAALGSLLAALASVVMIGPFAWWASSQSGQVSWIRAVEPSVALAILGNVVTSPDRLALDVPDTLGLAAIVCGTAAALLIAMRAAQSDRIVRLAAAAGVAVLPWLTLLTVSVVSPVLRTAYLAPSAIGVALLGASLAGAAASVDTKSMRHGVGVQFVAAALLAVILASTIPANVRAASAGFRHDDFRGLADELLAHAEPGDLVALVQRRHETGLTAGVARYAGDDALGREVEERLAAASAVPIEVRHIAATAPLRTARATAGVSHADGCSAWVVSSGALSDEEARLLRQFGVDPAVDRGGPHEFGGLRLTPAGCDS